jgi:hypothetical protein
MDGCDANPGLLQEVLLPGYVQILDLWGRGRCHLTRFLFCQVYLSRIKKLQTDFEPST